MSGAFFGGYRDVDDARAKLNAAKTAGADWIALHGLSRYPPGELEQISDEAHRLGLRVMAEGDPASRAERALAIGADSIEYLDRSVEGGYPAALVERLKNSNAYLVPPVGYFNRIVEMRRNQALSGDEMFTFFMPTEVAAGGAAAPGGIARQAGSYGRSSHEGQ
jgi:hypothetical protein